MKQASIFDTDHDPPQRATPPPEARREVEAPAVMEPSPEPPQQPQEQSYRWLEDFIAGW